MFEQAIHIYVFVMLSQIYSFLPRLSFKSFLSRKYYSLSNIEAHSLSVASKQNNLVIYVIEHPSYWGRLFFVLIKSL